LPEELPEFKSWLHSLKEITAREPGDIPGLVEKSLKFSGSAIVFF